MFIKKLILKNFRNFAEKELGFDGGINELNQTNGWGKTNVADAIAWVLTGKLHDGSSALDTIKPKANAQALVEAAIILDNGDSFKKTYAEQWTKNRSTQKMEMKGHEQKFYFGEAELKATEYKAKLVAYFGLAENFFQVLAIPTFFGKSLNWQERRALVTQIVGEPTFNDVVETGKIKIKNGDILEHDLLAYGGIAQLDKIYKKAARDLAKSVSEKEIIIANYDKEEPIMDNDEYEALKKKVANNHQTLYAYEHQKEATTDLASMKKEIEALRGEWVAVNAQKFTEPEPTIAVCPHCGKVLDEETAEKIKSDYEARKAAFGKSIEKQLAQINEHGRSLKARIEEAEKQTATTIDEAAMEILAAEINDDEAKISSFQVYLANLKKKGEITIEYRQESSKLANALAKVDQLKDYMVVYLELLNKRVSETFGNEISFRFISENIKEDSFDQVCDMMDGNVPYPETNTANQIRLGLKIIDVIEQKLDLAHLPIVIDNAEAIVDHSTLKSKAQIICLNAKETEEKNKNIKEN